MQLHPPTQGGLLSLELLGALSLYSQGASPPYGTQHPSLFQAQVLIKQGRAEPLVHDRTVES